MQHQEPIICFCMMWVPGIPLITFRRMKSRMSCLLKIWLAMRGLTTVFIKILLEHFPKFTFKLWHYFKYPNHHSLLPFIKDHWHKFSILFLIMKAVFIVFYIVLLVQLQKKAQMCNDVKICQAEVSRCYYRWMAKIYSRDSVLFCIFLVWFFWVLQWWNVYLLHSSRDLFLF